MTLFKYIVLIFCAFNIFENASAEVILDALPEDEAEVQKTPFINAGSLPHPAQLRQILDRSDNSVAGRMLILGRYFDAKYHGDALNKDITEEVALIFPEMSEKEVADMARNIKLAINVYRFGQQKLTETKEKIVAPSDPPLIVADDEYAVLGDRPYMPIDDGKYAVISDFKKVVTYGTDLREIKSWEAKLKRDMAKHRKKTDFEKFQEMFEKIEFSKLTSYGVTLPNPFVGNAGVGAWVEDEDGYRARLISELARTGQAEEVLTALHIVVPNHRLMLGIPKDDGQNRPVIALDHMQNIKSYEVLYPMPWQTSGENAVGVYAGDFAFIIKLKLENPSQPTYFEAALGFDDCDFELNCAAKKMNLSLDIQNDETGDDVKSSMLQFIRQSYYNMPKAHNKYVALKKASYDAATHQLNFEFSYDTSVKNWLFLLDNGHHSTFGVPKIILANHQIFVQVDVENGFENFEKTPLTYYLRLNSFAFLKQTIGLEKTWVESTSALPFKILLSAFCVGILFCLMPFGFYTLAAAMSDVGYSWKRKLMRTMSKTFVLTAFVGLVLYNLKRNPDLFYINLAHNLCYLGIVLSCMIFYFWRRDWPILKGKAGDVICGVTRGLWCVLMLCLVITPYQQTLMLSLTDTSDILKVYAGFGLVGGLLVPDMLAFWRKKAFSDKGRKGWIVSSDMMLGLAIAVVIFYISAQLRLTGSMKAVFWGLLAFSVLKYLMNFLSALYRTDLSIIQIRSATGVVLVLMALTVNVFAHKLQKLAPVPTEMAIPFDQIKSALNDGKNVLVAVNDKACLGCVYNRITALNQMNINRLSKLYPLEYIKTDATNTTPEMIAFFKEFKHLRAPLYVFYNALVPNGIVLPDLLSETEIARTLQRFAI